MPDHHLYAYFRYLVEHPELLHVEFNEKSQDERKTDGTENSYPDNAGGALSLLGSTYGSGEDDDGNASPSRDAKNVGSVVSATKDEPSSRKTIISKMDKVPEVKKNSSVLGSKPKSARGIKKEDNSSLFSAGEEKSKNRGIGANSKQIPEPPPEMKRMIDKLVEFVMRNGKQFEATILEQDSKLERFSFLLPSNQYHPYYIKSLQAAEESKVNGKSLYPGREDQTGRGISKKASALKENHISHSTSEFTDVPFESERKEKFKMVIGKSKKESQETEKESQESGFTVDAAAAAAILQAATKGIKGPGLQIIRSTAANSHSNEGRQEQSCSTTEKSDHLKTGKTSHGAAGGTDFSDANMTEEQKLKAERLKRAKMFVAMLKSGTLPSRTGTSRGSSAEPIESGMLKSSGEANRASQEREGSLAPASVDKPAAKSNFDEKQSERRSKRKYRSRSIGSEDDEQDSCREGHSSRKYRSSPRRHGDTKSHLSPGGEKERDKKEDEEVENAVKKYRKHHRRRHRSHSSSEESENGEERDKEDRDHKHYKSKHRSRHSRHDDNEREGTYEEERHKEHRKSQSRRSSGSKSRRHDGNNKTGNTVEKDDNGGDSTGDDKDDGRENTHKERRDHKRSKKSRHSHRSSRSSHHSRDKHKHRNEHSSKDKESRCHHKHDNSSDDEQQHRASSDQPRKELHYVRDELKEGEISYKAGKRGTLVDLQQRATSETTEVPDDLRAKIRAMLLATRS